MEFRAHRNTEGQTEIRWFKATAKARIFEGHTFLAVPQSKYVKYLTAMYEKVKIKGRKRPSFSEKGRRELWRSLIKICRAVSHSALHRLCCFVMWFIISVFYHSSESYGYLIRNICAIVYYKLHVNIRMLFSIKSILDNLQFAIKVKMEFYL